jgi:MFS family permease
MMASIGARETRSGPEWRAHWPLVLVGFFGSVLNVLPVYAVGVLMTPVVAELGWTRAEFFSGLSLSGFLVAFLVPFSGALIDRRGARSIALPGVALFCLGIAGLGLVGASLWQWWLVWALLGLSGATVTTNVWTGAIAGRFVKARGTALALALTGSGFAAAILPIAVNALIAQLGWRGACVALGAIIAAILLPLAARFLTAPVRTDEGGAVREPPPGLSLVEGLRSAAFYKLALSGLLVFIPLLAMVIHFVPIQRAFGLGAAPAAAAAGLIGVASICGRLVTGPLLDRLPGRVVGSVVLLLPIGAALLLSFHGGSAIVASIGALLLGGTLGAEISILAYLSTRYWGMRSYATLFGLILSCLGVAQATGPLLAAYIFDRSGSYQPFLLWCALPSLGAGLLLIGSLGPYPRFEGAQDPVPAEAVH